MEKSLLGTDVHKKEKEEEEERGTMTTVRSQSSDSGRMALVFVPIAADPVSPLVPRSFVPSNQLIIVFVLSTRSSSWRRDVGAHTLTLRNIVVYPHLQISLASRETEIPYAL